MLSSPIVRKAPLIVGPLTWQAAPPSRYSRSGRASVGWRGRSHAARASALRPGLGCDRSAPLVAEDEGAETETSHLAFVTMAHVEQNALDTLALRRASLAGCERVRQVGPIRVPPCSPSDGIPLRIRILRPL